jgi:hypothetical protein
MTPTTKPTPRRCALLLRGITHMTRYAHFSRAIVAVDFRRTADDVRSRLVEPLRAALEADGGSLDVFVATYRSPLQAEVLTAFGPVRDSVLLPYDSTRTQAGLMGAGLARVLAAQEGAEYDRVVVSRFDLRLRDGVDAARLLLPPPDDRRLLFSWRERSPEMWESDRCVGDALHSLTGGQVAALAAAVSGCRVQSNLHHVHAAVCAALPDGAAAVGFLVPDGCYDSNTDAGDNPLYQLVRGVVLQTRSLHNTNFYKRFRGVPMATLLR